LPGIGVVVGPTAGVVVVVVGAGVVVVVVGAGVVVVVVGAGVVVVVGAEVVPPATTVPSKMPNKEPEPALFDVIVIVVYGLVLDNSTIHPTLDPTLLTVVPLTEDPHV
jgi:hypothetical protein